MRIRIIAAIVVIAVVAVMERPRAADTARPAPSAETSSDVGNWGSVPYVSREQLILRPEEKTALRQLEDRHLQEMRVLEDRFEREFRTLRQKHFQERETLLRSFKR
ncbi:MAG: hypothetical protein HYS46_06410 [Betaproteobacteria bacterium]|nr:hypothetical protein [Betaproteobacteria bacterium]